jgi:hypothetical protein
LGQLSGRKRKVSGEKPLSSEDSGKNGEAPRERRVPATASRSNQKGPPSPWARISQMGKKIRERRRLMIRRRVRFSMLKSFSARFHASGQSMATGTICPLRESSWGSKR